MVTAAAATGAERGGQGEEGGSCRAGGLGAAAPLAAGETSCLSAAPGPSRCREERSGCSRDTSRLSPFPAGLSFPWRGRMAAPADKVLLKLKKASRRWRPWRGLGTAPAGTGTAPARHEVRREPEESLALSSQRLRLRPRLRTRWHRGLQAARGSCSPQVRETRRLRVVWEPPWALLGVS